MQVQGERGGYYVSNSPTNYIDPSGQRQQSNSSTGGQSDSGGAGQGGQQGQAGGGGGGSGAAQSGSAGSTVVQPGRGPDQAAQAAQPPAPGGPPAGSGTTPHTGPKKLRDFAFIPGEDGGVDSYVEPVPPDQWTQIYVPGVKHPRAVGQPGWDALIPHLGSCAGAKPGDPGPCRYAMRIAARNCLPEKECVPCQPTLPGLADFLANHVLAEYDVLHLAVLPGHETKRLVGKRIPGEEHALAHGRERQRPTAQK